MPVYDDSHSHSYIPLVSSKYHVIYSMFNEPGPYNMDMSGAYRICIDPDFDMDFPIGRC